VNEALIFFGNFIEDDPAPSSGDSLAPLRKAIETATHLAETMVKEIQDPGEERLRDLARKLGTAKKEIMALSRSLKVGQPASIAKEANRLASDAGEAIKSSRQTIKAALRGLGAASDISEVRHGSGHGHEHVNGHMDSKTTRKYTYLPPPNSSNSIDTVSHLRNCYRKKYIHSSASMNLPWCLKVTK
jgi:hypothetical protein